jgi:hypothetical protein
MENIINAVIKFGDRYKEEYLSENYLMEKLSIDVGRLREDSLEALKFFLSRTLFQGRRDEQSMEVYQTVVGVLEDKLGNVDEVERALRGKIGKGKVGKGRDVELVVETLSKFRNKNIVDYSIEMINNGRAGELYDELNEITGIGQKTSSLFLRDLALLFDLKVSEDDAKYMQPIDAWIKRGMVSLFGVRIGEDVIADKEKIAELCKTADDSVKFTAGLWFVGKHPYDVLKDLA